MKRNNVLLFAGIISILLLICNLNIQAQEDIDNKTKELDLKLQLLDTKLELLDSKIALWQTKPEELDMKMKEIDMRILDLDFDPNELNTKIRELESEIMEVKTLIVTRESQAQDFSVFEEEYTPVFKSAIMINPVRLFEGTFHISYERLLSDKFSVSVSALATYATQEGLTNYFFENQRFSYYDMASSSYQDYSGESIAGAGIILAAKNYLLADYPMHKKAPLGLYAAPQVMFRKIYITGEEQVFEDDEWLTKEVKQRLNVLSSGVVLGYKIPVAKVLVLDFFVGGHIRLSKYDGKSGLTKYRDWYNIDFSGVFPTAGIAIGILK